MKKFQLLFIFLLGFAITANAQKIGVVDTDYILGKLPQYKEAEARLNEQITNWQNEIQTLQTEFEKKKMTLENEKVLLIGDQLKQRQKEVDDLDKRIKGMINNRFGSMGEINNARSNLTKPFQDLIWGAIKTVSEKNTLGIVLDKSNNISVIFLDKRYDYTDKVLDLLLKNSPAKKTETDSKPVKRSPVEERNEKMKTMKTRSSAKAMEPQTK
ncbi:OmpH family outer membrane protein [Kaistella flava (ex Peng et al. 2021)]|uniref:OmpH family outer membrane protein n=1 Tax=Kaistella flava (ex Peng et al. 2021) TaxID=2038776 RepID=A0A7M2YD05_9FLAO|nr:OmpH family outer membrane protein [Kaistella flava (ex Peng et al. 2021)]QOW11342.1 OmpH family outer membrane protein [Kaistella flava (ex Peng et al. 2021)]